MWNSPPPEAVCLAQMFAFEIPEREGRRALLDDGTVQTTRIEGESCVIRWRRDPVALSQVSLYRIPVEQIA